MPIKPIEKLAPTLFTPNDQKDKPNPTRFRTRPMDGMEYLDVMPHAFVKDGYIHYDGEGMKKAIGYGLLGWENFRDDKGEEIPFNSFTMRSLSPIRLREIAMDIINKSVMTEEELGN